MIFHFILIFILHYYFTLLLLYNFIPHFYSLLAHFHLPKPLSPFLFQPINCLSMKAQAQSCSFLNAEKMKLHKNNQSPHSLISSKKTIKPSSPKKKYYKPIISFLNFSKNQLLQQNYTQPQATNSIFTQNRKEETFQFHDFQEHLSNISDFGSQYGQKNYDHDLKQVLKRHKRPARKQYNTPKVFLRQNYDRKENLQFPSKYQRFEKFQTQIQKKDSQIKQEVVNYESYDLQGNLSNKLSGFYVQSLQKQHRVKTQIDSKNQPLFPDCKSDQPEQQIDSREKIPQNQTSKPFHLIDSSITFQPIVFRKKSKQISPSHRRSRTQEDVSPKDNKKAQQIFRNYHKLKQNYFKATKKTDEFFQDYLKPATPTSIRVCELQTKTQQNHNKLNKQNKKHYRSLPKCQPIPVSQNFYHYKSPMNRVITAPKSLTRSNINEQILAKAIKQQKKEYFEKANGRPFELSNFTFDQIKQKISKLQLNEAKQIHNKSHNSFSKKNVLLYSELFVNGDKAKPQVEQEKQKDKTIKFKGIAFKANLIRKHTGIYEKSVKKIIDKNLSLKVTPKVSQLVI